MQIVITWKQRFDIKNVFMNMTSNKVFECEERILAFVSFQSLLHIMAEHLSNMPIPLHAESYVSLSFPLPNLCSMCVANITSLYLAEFYEPTHKHLQYVCVLIVVKANSTVAPNTSRNVQKGE